MAVFVRKCAVILYEILEDYMRPYDTPCTLYMMRQTIHAVANLDMFTSNLLPCINPILQ